MRAPRPKSAPRGSFVGPAPLFGRAGALVRPRTAVVRPGSAVRFGASSSEDVFRGGSSDTGIDSSLIRTRKFLSISTANVQLHCLNVRYTYHFQLVLEKFIESDFGEL